MDRTPTGSWVEVEPTKRDSPLTSVPLNIAPVNRTDKYLAFNGLAGEALVIEK